MAEPTIDDDLHELLELLPPLVRNLRRGSPTLRELKPLKRAFVQAELGERHGRVLLTLALSGPRSVAELAQRLALAPATTSLLVGELDRAGFLVRHEDEADRRRTIVSLPERLRSALEEVARERLEPIRRTLEQLEPGARAHFVEGVRILSAEVARQPS
jgi:DNA-binding MarR family transcriptional regulator